MTSEEILIEDCKRLGLTEIQESAISRFYSRTKNYNVAVDYINNIASINRGEIKRTFKLVCPPRLKSVRGVYKINFDSEKFYIGRSKIINTRIVQHGKEIRKYFEERKYKKGHYLSKLFKHLEEDPLAYYFTVELLDECFTIDELQEKEQKWLDHYKDSPNCINLNFISKKIDHEIDDTPVGYSKTVKARKEAKKAYKKLSIAEKSILYAKRREVEGATQAIIKERKRIEDGVEIFPEKSQRAKSFSFNVPEILSDQGPVVYKLYCGKKYIIVKGKTLNGSIFIIQKGCGYFLNFQHDQNGGGKNEYYFKFYKYVKSHPNLKFKVEIILISDDGGELLIAEQKELNKSFSDKKCLNSNVKSYVNVYNETKKMYGWLTPSHVEKYYSFMATQVSI